MGNRKISDHFIGVDGVEIDLSSFVLNLWNFQPCKVWKHQIWVKLVYFMEMVLGFFPA